MAQIEATATHDPSVQSITYQYFYVRSVAASTSLHIAIPRSDAPVSVISGITQVPTDLHWAVATQGTGSSAWVGMSGPGISPWSAGKDNGGSDSGVQPFLLNAGGFYDISANAAGTAGVSVYGDYSSNVFASADPFLVIDPSWEYASYFMVLQQSNLDPTKWVVVTRAWQNPAPVPIPGAAWLLGSGIVGLIGLKRRMRK